MQTLNVRTVICFSTAIALLTSCSVARSQQAKITPIWSVNCHKSEVVDIVVDEERNVIASVDSENLLTLFKYDWPEFLCATTSSTPFRKLVSDDSGDFYALNQAGKILRIPSGWDGASHISKVEDWTDGRNLLHGNGKVYVVEGARFGLVKGGAVRSLPSSSHNVGAVINDKLWVPVGNLKFKVYDISGRDTELTLAIEDAEIAEEVSSIWHSDMKASSDRIFVLFKQRGGNAIGEFNADGVGEIFFSTGHMFGWQYERISGIEVSDGGRFLIACGSKCRIWDVRQLDKPAVFRGSVFAERDGRPYFTCACGRENKDGSLEVVYGTIDGYLGRVRIAFE